MKSTIKFSGIIVLIAIIGFSMAACGGEDNNTPASKTYILSLDKVNDKSFTISIEGGEWKSGTSFSYFGDYDGGLKFNGYYDEGKNSGILYESCFNVVKTSSTVLTFTLKSSYSNLRGTASFKYGGSGRIIDNIVGSSSYDIITYNVEKSSISWQAW